MQPLKLSAWLMIPVSVGVMVWASYLDDVLFCSSLFLPHNTSHEFARLGSFAVKPMCIILSFSWKCYLPCDGVAIVITNLTWRHCVFLCRSCFNSLELTSYLEVSQHSWFICKSYRTGYITSTPKFWNNICILNICSANKYW